MHFLFFYFLSYHLCFSFKIPDVQERLRQDSVGKTRASNLVFTVWAVFGGFILHFLLSNYLTVLLRPKYEEPIETAADMVRRDITPFYFPGMHYMRAVLAASPIPENRELSKKLYIPNDYDEMYELADKVQDTGLYAMIGTTPWAYPEEFKDWYRSSETLGGFSKYSVHLTNKKWPIKKVLLRIVKTYILKILISGI